MVDDHVGAILDGYAILAPAFIADPVVANAQMAHDHIIRVLDHKGRAPNAAAAMRQGNAFARRALASDGYEGMADARRGAGETDQARYAKDADPRPQSFDAIAQAARPGIGQCRHPNDPPAAAALAPCAIAFGAREGRDVGLLPDLLFRVRLSAAFGGIRAGGQARREGQPRQFRTECPSRSHDDY